MQRRVRIEDVWPELSSGTLQVLSNSKTAMTRLQWMQLYTLVHDYCSSPYQGNETIRHGLLGNSPTGAQLKGQAIYERVVELLSKYLEGLLQEMEAHAGSGELLSFYMKSWEQYLLGSSRIDRLYDYLNRHWVQRERGDKNLEIYDVNTLCLVSWRLHLFQAVKTRLLHGILVLIEKERKGDQIDRSLLDIVIKSFVRLGVDQERVKETNLSVYQTDFETALLSTTEAFYMKESAEFVASNTCVDYMIKAEACLEREAERVRHYLHSSSEKKLLGTCEQVLLTRQKDMFWAEFPNLLRHNRQVDLKRMYSLLHRANLLEPLRSVLEEHITTEGLESVKKIDQANVDPATYVDSLLVVYKQYHDMITNCFNSDPSLSASLDKACRKYMNENSITKASNSSKTPELLARFCDTILKKGSKTLDESETENALANIMLVFKYIEDKDVFQKFYSKRLSTRLINGTSASDDAEASMIERLKKECGFDYTTKFQRMVSDMNVSQTLNEEFQDHLKTGGKDEINLDYGILVLTHNTWPLTPPTTNFNIPLQLEKALTVFQNYYQTRFQGRKLTWMHQLSKAELKTLYLAQSKVLMVSTYQMGVLVQFNDGDKFTYAELQLTTGLNDLTLRGTLEPLVEGQILLCSEKVDDSNYQGNHEFTLNMGYTNKRQRVPVSTVLKVEQKQEVEQTQKFVDDDRRLQIQVTSASHFVLVSTFTDTNLDH
eukprot:TRINITY_DN1855_c0_g1_i3.p1 TRINITY_DN1855_c0_g1~~TRINITY_DN1855_c0_g1_i3.p1  ORF type:complete len:715 (-),score=131.21 TRINITY_DN1855_c0_g1_i3:235-2379(-)